jgi:hypothetical protein
VLKAAEIGYNMHVDMGMQLLYNQEAEVGEACAGVAQW